MRIADCGSTAKTPRAPRGYQITGFSLSHAAFPLTFLGDLGVLAVRNLLSSILAFHISTGWFI
jgi:hypothetical protein